MTEPQRPDTIHVFTDSDNAPGPAGLFVSVAIKMPVTSGRYVTAALMGALIARQWQRLTQGQANSGQQLLLCSVLYSGRRNRRCHGL